MASADVDELPLSRQRHVITPAGGFRLPNVGELWRQRDLIYLLMRRDVAVRYKQTAIGAAWAVLQPLLFAAVFSIFLGAYAKVPASGGVPYPIFALTGMVIWLYFSGSLAHIADSTVANAQLITKVYFSRIIIPISATARPLMDFLIAFTVVIPAMLIYGEVPSLRILALPLVIALALLISLGLGLWLAALNVRYRDVGFIVPFISQVGLFVTPIIYPFSLIPSAIQPFYALNPMVGVIETYRWLLFPGAEPPGLLLVVPLVAAVVLLVSGAWYFLRSERDFADII